MRTETILDSGARSEIVAAHLRTVEALGRPGVRWTSAERIAIADEQRRALTDDRNLAPWEVPSRVDVMTTSDHVLPPAAVDAIWRLTNHPHTLTHDWYLDVISRLATVEHYVELVGVVVTMTSVDRLASALGLGFIALPDPGAGEPSGSVVAAATITTHWVPTVAGEGANVFEALTALPDGDRLREMLGAAHFMTKESLFDMDLTRGVLNRSQMELVASRTAHKNGCFY